MTTIPQGTGSRGLGLLHPRTTPIRSRACTQFLRFDLINKHGVSDHRGEVLIRPSEIESIRSFVHADRIFSYHEVGSIVTTKTDDKHYVSQHTDEIAEMLRAVAAGGEDWVGSRTAGVGTV